MKKISIWMDSKFDSKIRVLDKNTSIDVLIIGGGITGLSVAYNLIDSGLKVVLVEKNTIGSGITSRTTGKITFLQQNIYSKILKHHTIDEVRLYYESQKEAIKRIVNIIKKEKIECNLIKNKSYLFSNNIDDLSLIDDEKKILEEFNEKIHYSDSYFDVGQMKYQICVDDTYVFHPLKYLYRLKDICSEKGIRIYERTTVYKITKKDNMYLCYANGKIIKAKKVVLALHYPYFLKPYYFPFKGSLEKSYVAACKVDKISKSNGITPSTPILSFRYHADKEKYIIYLNGSHIIQDKIDNEKCFDKLKKEVEELGLKISYIWSNYDIMTKDSLPIVGRIEENLYIATGYNTWGMTNATLAGIIIADLVRFSIK